MNYAQIYVLMNCIKEVNNAKNDIQRKREALQSLKARPQLGR